MASDAAPSAPSERCSGSFEYCLPFTRFSEYERGQCVRSPTMMVGKCPVGLNAYPRGAASSGSKGLCAIVEVRPRDDWEDWSFRDPRVTVEVLNADGKKPQRGTNVHTFDTENPEQRNRIPLKCDYDALKRQGWVFPDDTIRFHVVLEGSSLGESKREPPEDDQYARMLDAMKFPDAFMCTDDGSTELPCHRAVLAMRSPVFDRMLSSDMKEGLERRILLPNVSSGTLTALREYIYTGSIPEDSELNLQILCELLPLGDQFDLSDLCEECAGNLVEIMSAANFRVVIPLLRSYRNNPMIDGYFREAKEAAKQDEMIFDALINECGGAPLATAVAAEPVKLADAGTKGPGRA